MKYIWRQLLYKPSYAHYISPNPLACGARAEALICDDVKLFVSDISLSIFAEMNVWWCHPCQAILDKKEDINIVTIRIYSYMLVLLR